jgi:DNA invertase Pin-like site-specific DNA recombinase
MKQRTRTKGAVNDGAQRATALIYVRVSSIGQVNTDRDGEGFSIAAQKDACIHKAEQLGADVLDIYVEAGESARTADRPKLQDMLQRLRDQRAADYVIVHKVDRLARNRGDDVEITLVIRQAGAQLISVTENIDETPSGMLLHGIMSSIAEFYSQNLSNEIIKGTSKKAQRGAYPGLAPLGYKNVQDLSGGNELRWIEVDAERAPHITWAFEAYASGDFTLRQLAEALDERGLRTKGTPKRPSGPLGPNDVHRLLRKPFYIGRFTWGGVEYQGTHEPLTTVETFATVQAQLAAKKTAGERTQRHEHYLKGTIACGRCGSRMIFSRNKGRGGVYDYFVCLGRHENRTLCDLPYVSVDDVEEQIEHYYQTIKLDATTADTLYGHIIEAAKKRNAQAFKMGKQQRKRIEILEAERRSLLKAHLAGAVPLELLAEEQARITDELAKAAALMANSEIHREELQRNLRRALASASNLGSAYVKAGQKVRRQMNQAIFEEILIDFDGAVIYARMAQPFAAFHDEEFRTWLADCVANPGTQELRGSNNDLLVEVSRLEPTRTPCSAIAPERAHKSL